MPRHAKKRVNVPTSCDAEDFAPNDVVTGDMRDREGLRAVVKDVQKSPLHIPLIPIRNHADSTKNHNF